MRRWQNRQQQNPKTDNVDDNADDDEPCTSLAKMLIQSSNTLQEQEIDLHIFPGWSDKPPVLTGPRGQPESNNLLKGLIRRGIPPALRCAIWLSNVITAVHPHQDAKYWHDYRTLAKVRSLDHAYEGLLRTKVSVEDKQSNKNKSSSSTNSSSAQDDSTLSIFKLTNKIWKDRAAPTYGRSSSDEEDISKLIPNITARGRMAQKRVLIALESVVLVEYAPLLPILSALLLTAMSESYAFTAIREMSHDTKWYFPITRREHQAHGRAFTHILFKLHPQTAEYLADRGVLEDDSLHCIFGDFFLDILPLPLVLRIMDIYTLEGTKVLFRIGVSLCVLYRREAAEQLVTISNASEWWHTMKHWTHYKDFNFDVVLRKAYGVHGKVLQNQLRFPSRNIIQRIVKAEEEHMLYEQRQGGSNNGDDDDDDNINASYSSHASPLGLADGPPELIGSGNATETVQRVLAQSLEARQHLANWVPLTMRLTNLDLIYSTNYHGRDLDIFFERVKNARHSILLAEVLDSNTTNDDNSSSKSDAKKNTTPTVVGMYASQAWRVSSQVYGDGECFLFRLSPNPRAWKWRPDKNTATRSSKSNDNKGKNDLTASIKALDLMNENSNNNNDALLRQFMVSTTQYISMGGNADGSCGLRINQDLTRGESSTAAGFGNEALHHAGSASGGGSGNDNATGTTDKKKKGGGSVFEIGLVEVYGFVRQIDGKPV